MNLVLWERFQKYDSKDKIQITGSRSNGMCIADHEIEPKYIQKYQNWSYKGHGTIYFAIHEWI